MWKRSAYRVCKSGDGLTANIKLHFLEIALLFSMALKLWRKLRGNIHVQGEVLDLHSFYSSPVAAIQFIFSFGDGVEVSQQQMLPIGQFWSDFDDLFCCCFCLFKLHKN